MKMFLTKVAMEGEYTCGNLGEFAFSGTWWC